MVSGLRAHVLTSHQAYYDRNLAESLATWFARGHFADYIAEYRRNSSMGIKFSQLEDNNWEKTPVTIEIFDRPYPYCDFIHPPNQKDSSAAGNDLVHLVIGDTSEALPGPYLSERNIREVFELFAVIGTKTQISIDDTGEDMYKLFEAAKSLFNDFKRRGRELVPGGCLDLVFYDNKQFYTPAKVSSLLKDYRQKT